MSVEPRNGLWNRLLARAEARAKEGSPPEEHHYHPLSAGDDHLRASFENSLIYHGLKIETEFSLRLQRPPRKRKVKRKVDLPVTDRLRNDRAAAGSPGPTHRTPTATPARRISKTTPLSRPPVPPVPPLPPIQATTRAAAARERVLNAVTDDDEPPLRREGPLLERPDSSDDHIFIRQAAKPDGCRVIVLPHFDEAADSNDTSSWEDHAILVGQLPKGQESGESGSKHPGSDARSPSDVSPVVDLTPRLKLSKRNRTRSSRARKIASSDNSPAPPSDFGKSENETDSVDGNRSGQNSGQQIKQVENLNMNMPCASKERKETDSLKQDENGSKKKETCGTKEKATKCDNSCTPGSNPLSTNKLFVVLRNLGAKGIDIRRTVPKPLVISGSLSDEERSTPSRGPSLSVRSVPARRRQPSDISVEDKLFGPLSPLSSPRRRTRSAAESEECFMVADKDPRTVEAGKRTSSRQKNKQKALAAASQGKSRSQVNATPETQLRRSPRRLQQNHGRSGGVYELEVIPSGPTVFKRAQCEQGSGFTAQNHPGSQRKLVRKSAQRDPSSDGWENSLTTVAINVAAPPKLSRKAQGGKSTAASSLNRHRDENDKTNRKKGKSSMKKRVRSRTLRKRKFSMADDDASDQSEHHEYVALESAKSTPKKRKRRAGSSSRTITGIHQPNEPIPVQRKQSHRKAKSEERAKQERNAGCSEAVQEILDSDSDICIVKFSPATGKGTTRKGISPDNPRDSCEGHVTGQGSGNNRSNRDQVEVIKCSSDNPDTCPTKETRKEATPRTSKGPGVKVPLRLRRRLELAPGIHRNSVGDILHTALLRTPRKGGSLSVSDSDEFEEKDVVETRNNSGPEFRMGIPVMPMTEQTRGSRVLAISDSDDDSNDSRDLSWCSVYTKAESASKYGVLKSEYEEYMSKRRSLKQDLEIARNAERSGVNRKRSSSIKAALRDLRMEYGRLWNSEKDGRDSSRKKRRRKV